jgi:hypothetical protein
MKERGGTVTAVRNHRADLAKSLPVPKRLTTRKKVLVYLFRFWFCRQQNKWQSGGRGGALKNG